MNHSSTADRRPPPQPLLDVIRPNFFPGQSLSDKDLAALMTWAEQRWRLEAACDDWGIACGLHVSINPDDPSQVLISPGYGFNSARQLVVVSESDCGCGEKPRCMCQGKHPKTYSLHKPNCFSCNDNKTVLRIGPLRVKQSEVFVFDLWLTPDECEQSHLLGLSTDGRRNCHPSRIKASAAIMQSCFAFPPPNSAVNAGKSTSAAIEFLQRRPKVTFPLSGDDAVKVRAWLTDEATRLPELLSVGLSLVKAAIELVVAKTGESQLTVFLSWMAFFLRQKRGCNKTQPEEPSIPLARIWTRCTGSTFEILWIDESSPYRRSMCCQQPMFCPDDWIGESFAAAQNAAKRTGVAIEELPPPDTIDKLIALLQQENPCARPAETVKALCVLMLSVGNDTEQRVLAFWQGSAAANPASGDIAGGTNTDDEQSADASKPENRTDP